MLKTPLKFFIQTTFLFPKRPCPCPTRMLHEENISSPCTENKFNQIKLCWYSQLLLQSLTHRAASSPTSSTTGRSKDKVGILKFCLYHSLKILTLLLHLTPVLSTMLWLEILQTQDASVVKSSAYMRLTRALAPTSLDNNIAVSKLCFAWIQLLDNLSIQIKNWSSTVDYVLRWKLNTGKAMGQRQIWIQHGSNFAPLAVYFNFALSGPVSDAKTGPWGHVRSFMVSMFAIGDVFILINSLISLVKIPYFRPCRVWNL